MRRVIADDFGPLVRDPEGICDLPDGFRYTVISPQGEPMDDGLVVPALPDGMAAFPGENGLTVLVRNHELLPGDSGPFGPGNALIGEVPAEKIFDAGFGRAPSMGGTTTLHFDTASQTLEQHFLSLAGTSRNCAGGPTPWGSWVTCEEYPVRAGNEHEQDHGWCFEVPAAATELVDPVPLAAMGRFNHEAIAVDAKSGAVYQTEDQADSLFYRYLPDVPGDLAAGGELQALAVRGAPSLDTRNWNDFTRVKPGQELEVSWITLDDVESPNEDLRHRGFLQGAARFARGEGLWAGDGEIYFAATSGGPAFAGQIWRYVPSPDEGTKDERKRRGKLELFFESPHRRLVDMCDNLTLSPWGDVVLCEDGAGQNYLVGVTARGDVYPLARNAIVGSSGNASEFAGATFSPDGTTLFCNLQGPGLTLAITGPWPS